MTTRKEKLLISPLAAIFLLGCSGAEPAAEDAAEQGGSAAGATASGGGERRALRR